MRGKIVEYITKANTVNAVIFCLLGSATANIPRTSFYSFISVYTLWFIFYLLICKNISTESEKEITSSLSPSGILNSLSAYQWIAILSRMFLFFTIPLLSDDVYRFIWDGQIVAAGHNPFDYTPDWYMSHAHTINNLNADLYNQLNSKPFFTVYPPVCQAIFGVSALVGGASMSANIFCIKLFLLVLEILTIIILPKIIKQFSINKNYAIVYLLNPLVIIETMGNCHFEGIMVSFFLMAIYFYKKNNLAVSSILFALSVLTKLITVIGLPLILLLMPWRQRFFYCAITAVVIMISFS
jgi:Gpi18-like mannosyltransferase